MSATPRPVTASTPAAAPLRVALATETYPPEVNGVAVTLERLVAGLLDRGHGVEVIRPRQAQASRQRRTGLDELEVRGLTLPCYDTLKLGLASTARLKRRWEERRPDIVHIATEGPLGWVALRAARALGLPVSADFHTHFHAYSAHYGAPWLRQPILRYLRHFHNRVTATLVPTTSLLEQLERLGFRNLVCVSRGVDTRQFSPEQRDPQLRERWGAAPGDPVALYVGRLAAEKNLPLVFDAYAAMRAVAPRARLVIVGDGPLRATLEKLHPEALFAGQRAGDELAAHYASADVLVFPSTTETYGNVTVEGLASGLAVVAYDYAAAGEHLSHERNGISVPFDDPDSFVRHAAALAADPLRVARLRAAARETALRLDWTVVAGAFEQTLIQLTRDRKDYEYPLGLSA